jgi:hypothetical protein
MFLGLAVASSGFAINVILDGRMPNSVILVPVILWVASVFSGCMATFSRLLDFRHTARKIKDGGKSNTWIAKWSGPITWAFFWAQALTYLFGACFFVLGFLGHMKGQSA